jgi:hypothetical protein
LAAAPGEPRPPVIGDAPVADAERTVPGYASAKSRVARTSYGGGVTDQVVPLPSQPGDVPLWGDWNGDGAFTPAIFRNGDWLLFDALAGRTFTPRAPIRFGAPGDTPVVGDFNGDRRTDIGVFRKGVWFFRFVPGGKVPFTGGRPQLTLRYGAPTDRPIVGDWNGDGKDTVGVRRGTIFKLSDTLVAGKPAWTFNYGFASDEAVAGDWDGNRTDTIALVRGSRWILRATNLPKSRYIHFGVSRPADSIALPWRTLAGPIGNSCPTTTTRVARNAPQAPYVVPSARLDATAIPTDAGAVDVYASMQDAMRYLATTRYDTIDGPKVRQRYYDALATSGTTEYAVRFPASTALTLATGLRTGAYDPVVVGRSAEFATEYATWLIRGVACQHAAVSPGGWGYLWQSPYWAALAGSAAWLLWDDLPAQVKEYVARMVVSEADHALDLPVAYWQDRAGNPLTPGDSKAEEDSWSSMVLELAVAMMPKHPRAAGWRAKAIEFETASFARPVDLANPAVINGIPVKDRLGGANIFNDGTLENHRIIHPDYMTTVSQNLMAGVYAGLAGRRFPLAALFNAPVVYGAFWQRSFEVPPFLAPGGTVYRTDAAGVKTPDIYFPQGTDWGAGRRAEFVAVDALASTFGVDGAGGAVARQWMTVHAQAQRALQNRWPFDGRTFSDPAEDRYPGREEYAASQLATAWLALYVGQNARVGIDRAYYGPVARAGSVVRKGVKVTVVPAGRVGATGPVAPVQPRLSP